MDMCVSLEIHFLMYVKFHEIKPLLDAIISNHENFSEKNVVHYVLKIRQA